jgi:hypothetical protein
MAYQQTINWSRPNITVPWFEWDNAIKKYIVNTYIDTKLLLTVEVAEGSEGLTKRITRTFASQEACNQFKSDSILVAAATIRNNYITEHGLTVSKTETVV